MGSLGQKIAHTALHFGMKVAYYSRTRKPHLESEKITYMPLESLVANCDVITTHLPKHTILMTQPIFELKKRNSIFINTTLGPTYEKDALTRWLKSDPSSFAIFDQEGASPFAAEFSRTDNMIVYPFTSGFTVEAKKRLSLKVLQNMEEFLGYHQTRCRR